MRQVIKWDKSNAACGIQRGGKVSGRHVVLAGADKVTSKQARKTRKGAADLLYQDDEQQEMGKPPMFNAEQRASLLERANGGSSKLYREGGRKEKGAKKVNPLERRPNESEDEHVARLNALVMSGEMANLI